MDGTTGRAVRAFLIADIRGYTAFTAARGDEAASRLAMRFANIVGEAVQAWGGRLVELRGDEALCVFDELTAALRASVELQDVFVDETTADPSTPLRVGIGLATGDAVPVGSGFRGSALNLAARLCGVSAEGEVHASVDLVERCGPVEGLQYDHVAGLHLKGFDEKQQAYLVRPTVVHAAHAVIAGPTTPEAELAPALDVSRELAGREAEMRWLAWHWRRARHGHGGVVVLEGANGVGKTRLAAELASAAQQGGAMVRYHAGEAGGAALGPSTLDGDRPSLVIVDGEAAIPAMLDGAKAWGQGKRSLRVVIFDDATSPQGAKVPGSDGLPRLLVRPLDLDGVRALGAVVAPAAADELPIARILEATEGSPGPARQAVLEWADRVEAERSAGTASASLPAERSSFVGRVTEIKRARALLDRSRLLTLTGPPGTGKTRLALHLAHSVAEDFPDGTFFVPLAAIGDEALVGSAMARALQLRIGSDMTALDVVAAYLAERRALLVLDNFEQLHSAAGQVGELLAGAPRLKVLVASRWSLELSGEQVYPVPPLEVPKPGAVAMEDVARSDAAALFVLRARSVDPDFDLRPDNAEVIAGIAARLEGLPLAIELAAARVRTLGCYELLEHLHQRLPLLTGGRADTAERHQTMRDAIAWSYDLLGAEEQRLLRHLSVFRGGFGLPAAARLVERPEAETLEAIDALVGQSLVQRSHDRPFARFGLLELIREFSGDELKRHGELAEAASRHTAVLLEFVGELEPIFEGSGPGDATDRLMPEIDNLRAALEHSFDEGDVESGLLLASCPWRFWQCIGQLAEGRRWVERALDQPGGSVTARAKATAALGGLAYWLGDFGASRESYQRARDLYTAAGDRTAETNAVYSLSLVATYEGELDTAQRYADEAMELARSAGDEAMIAEVLAAQFLIAWKSQDLARAEGLGEAALEIAQRLGLSAILATQLVGLAGVAHSRGDVDQALRLAGQALELTIETENTHTQIFALDSIASFAATRSPTRAVRLCASAASLRIEHGGGWTLEVMGVKCASSAAQALLRPDELEAARQSGAGLSLDAATGVARTILAEPPEAPTSGSG